jgi:pre-mRNA-processing factor SLU7
LTHTAKTCIERPRKIGAKYTGKNIGQDEVISHVKLNYEGKRDRWNGYDPDQYKAVIDEWEILENERRRRKEQAIQEKL